MSSPRYLSRRLQIQDRLESFDSGQPALDRWLVGSAHHADAMRTARTWVWVDGEEVVAYFSLSGHAVKRSDVPRKVGRGSPEWIPTVLIARLALDKRLHGQGLGAELLIGSWRRIIEASELVALRIVVVDAIDDSAVMFYEHFGFDVIPGTRRLVRRVSDIASDLADD